MAVQTWDGSVRRADRPGRADLSRAPGETPIDRTEHSPVPEPPAHLSHQSDADGAHLSLFDPPGRRHADADGAARAHLSLFDPPGRHRSDAGNASRDDPERGHAEVSNADADGAVTARGTDDDASDARAHIGLFGPPGRPHSDADDGTVTGRAPASGGVSDGWADSVRTSLGAAARTHDWMAVFEIAYRHPHLVNSSSPDDASWSAPLHHAARGGVSREIAGRLVVAGAWRGLRDATGERPVDLARRLGQDHLVEFLEPPRRVDVSAEALAKLQEGFHELIRRRMREFGVAADLRLPELEVLLELDRPEMWFPIPGMHGGFHYRLITGPNGVRLAASSWSRVIGGSERRDEITGPAKPPQVTRD